MKLPRACRLWAFLSAGLLAAAIDAAATSNYHYGPQEYVTVSKGDSPDGKYAIVAHGEGELGYDNFHLYLTSRKAKKKMAVLLEISDALDTGAGAFQASWNDRSDQVSISYRVDRRVLATVVYKIVRGKPVLSSGPVLDKPAD